MEDTLTLISPIEAAYVLGGNGGSGLPENATIDEILNYYSDLGFTFAQDANVNYMMTGGGTYQGTGIMIDPVTVTGNSNANSNDSQYGVGLQAMLNRFLDERGDGSETTGGDEGSTGSDGSSVIITGGVITGGSAGGGANTGSGTSNNSGIEGYWTFENGKWKWNGKGAPNPNAMHYGENIQEVVVRPPSLNDIQWQKLNYLMSVSDTVGKMTFNLPIADNTFEAVSLYYIGIGRSVTIGPNSMRDLLSSDKFYNFHLNASQKPFGTVIGDGLNFTDTVFHIGRTSVKAFVGNGHVTYMMFDGDGFKDPNFWAEHNNWSTPDGNGPNLELGGNTYDYNVTVFSLPIN